MLQNILIRALCLSAALYLAISLPVFASETILKRLNGAEAVHVETVCLLHFIHEIFGDDESFVGILILYRDIDMRYEERLIQMLGESGKYAVETRSPENQLCDTISSLHLKKYIIFVESSKELHMILHHSLCQQWSSSTYFIMIVPIHADVDGMLNLLREHSIYSAYIVSPQPTNGTLLLWYTKPRCDQIAYLNGSVIYSLQNKTQVERYDSFKSIQCHLRIGVRYLEPFAFEIRSESKRHGLNLDVAYGLELVTIYNVWMAGLNDDTSKFIFLPVHDLGSVDDIGNGTGLMKALHDGEADILVGALQLPSEPFVGVAYPQYYGNMVVIVKKRQNLDALRLFSVMECYVWVILAAASLLCIFIMYRIQLKTKKIYFNLSTIGIYIFASFLGKGVPLDKKQFRLTFLAWMWFAFIVRSTFEVLLVYLLVDKDKFFQINTLDELCIGKKRVWMNHVYKSYVKNILEIPNCNFTEENIKLVGNPLEELYKSDETDIDFALMYKNDYTARLQDFLSKPYNPFHVLKEPLYSTPLFLYFHRGDPIIDIFRKRIFQFMDNGFTDYYEKYSYLFMEINYIQKFGIKETSSILTMQHELLVFLMYVWGMGLSIAVFIIELIIHRVYARRPN